ncbi:uncharacterized protein BDW47DRAFT_100418 [Aspergillus candidus]|uniref:Uncharacterized protein n=1 Tax=Aspergillus candidus TaxID=41067 RepID=A0A2I2FKA2_ASPCN|nr:hypothetical protein BDW47DRAFT_100418 [Aspergillus candidus]PLB41050.1 hypothetical protein BDW47DRAFT_100418 [Aspergillus candidus]
MTTNRRSDNRQVKAEKKRKCQKKKEQQGCHIARSRCRLTCRKFELANDEPRRRTATMTSHEPNQ